MCPITILGISKGKTIKIIIVLAKKPDFGIFFAISSHNGIWIDNAKNENKKLLIKDSKKSEDTKSCLNQYNPTHI